MPGGALVIDCLASPRFNTICFVSATRSTESDFWTHAPLGQSLKIWLREDGIRADIRFENSAGLPEVYNRHLQTQGDTDIHVFLHDDVWLNDPLLLQKIRSGLRRFDMIGVAGNRRRIPRQPAWLFSHQDENGQFVWDFAHLSGVISHGRPGAHAPMIYGPSAQACELMDGVFLAVRGDYVQALKLRFDERFRFDLYDLDFCRTARKHGLSLGTWPIDLIHESTGNFSKESYERQSRDYFEKWGS